MYAASMWHHLHHSPPTTTRTRRCSCFARVTALATSATGSRSGLYSATGLAGVVELHAPMASVRAMTAAAVRADTCRGDAMRGLLFGDSAIERPGRICRTPVQVVSHCRGAT